MASYRPPAPTLQDQDLEGKIALITGATKGIGRAIALNVATRGCCVLGTYSVPESAHNFNTLTHTVRDLYNASTTNTALHPKLKGVAADITNLASVETVLASLQHDMAAAGLGGGAKLDILVINAAVNLRPRLGSATHIDIQNSLVANLQWPIVLVEALVSQQLFRPNARIVVLSSDRVRDPAPGTSLFNATKCGLESLARSWALELPLIFPGTTVNAVSVGLTDTPGLRALPPAAVEAAKAQQVPKVKVIEGGRMGFPEDVADVVGWLVSEKARWQTGSVVAANGGAEWVGGT